MIVPLATRIYEATDFFGNSYQDQRNECNFTSRIQQAVNRITVHLSFQISLLKSSHRVDTYSVAPKPKWNLSEVRRSRTPGVPGIPTYPGRNSWRNVLPYRRGNKPHYAEPALPRRVPTHLSTHFQEWFSDHWNPRPVAHSTGYPPAFQIALIYPTDAFALPANPSPRARSCFHSRPAPPCEQVCSAGRKRTHDGFHTQRELNSRFLIMNALPADMEGQLRIVQRLEEHISGHKLLSSIYRFRKLHQHESPNLHCKVR